MFEGGNPAGFLGHPAPFGYSYIAAAPVDYMPNPASQENLIQVPLIAPLNIAAPVVPNQLMHSASSTSLSHMNQPGLNQNQPGNYSKLTLLQFKKN